ANGAHVLTIEGLATDGKLHPMQEAFRENHGLQCGFCTPGMIMAAVDIVRRKGHEPEERTIRAELEGNICRCTGHPNIAKPDAAAGLTGAELAADKIGNLICGWMIHSKDGTPMKMSAHPAIADGKVCHVGDQVAVVIAETLAQAKDAAEKVKVDYEVLPAIADPARAQAPGAPQIHEIAPNNTIYQWHLGDPQASEAAFKSAKHVTRLD